MTEELRLKESGADGVRRILRKQLGKAIESLSDPKALSDENVHDIRRNLKRARATLRLLRPAIGWSCYQRANDCYRDAARPLTELRDAKVLVDTVDALRRRFYNDLSSDAVDSIRQTLVRYLRELGEKIRHDPHLLPDARDSLNAAYARVKDWRLGNHGWRVVRDGLKWTYDSGRQCLAELQKHPRDETRHEWRKQAKYYRYQLELLQPVWPVALDGIIAQARALADLLGEDHDLVILRHNLEDLESFPDRNAVQQFKPLIERRQAKLQKQADEIGPPLYIDKPKTLIGRLNDLWRYWRAA